jgi:serine/threonine protein kinase
VTGRTISHYEVLEKLGAGGMGEIYKARDPRLNRTVAIKALPASATSDPERRRRFVQEAQAASGLNHPNIIVIHDILTDESGGDYMVMEFVAGKTLAEAIHPGGLGVAKTLQYGAQIADALAAAHAAGIIHRDLKPGNVMVTDGNRVKVLDFGLAKVTVVTSLTDATQTLGSGPLTVEGSILGTVSYMSPEQAQGKRVDARSDIFAFGALLYEMITGRKAFEGESALETLTAILRDDVKPVAELAPGIPPELANAITRALRKNPDERWQTMDELYGVLSSLRTRYESGILTAPPQIPPPPPRKPRLPWGAAMAAFGITVGFGGWWVALHRHPKPQSLETTPPPAAAAPAVPAPGPKTGDKPSPTAPTAVPPVVAEEKAPPTEVPAVRPADTKTVVITDGLPVVLKLSEDVPNNPEPGTPLHFSVKQDFKVGETTVIHADAAVTGEVAGIKKGLLGRGGKSTYRLTSVEGVDGSKIALRASDKAGEKSERVLEPSSRKDKSVLAPAGTEYIAYIDGAQAVVVRK